MSQTLRETVSVPPTADGGFDAPRVMVADKGHPRRGAIERFIEARYQTAFGARGLSHYPLLAALRGADGAIRAAAGVRFAAHEPLFLERYLDQPVEQVVAEAFARPVARASIVEVGSLASDSPVASLELFATLSTLLPPACHRGVAVLTARPELALVLGRAGFELKPLGPADPARLGGRAVDWGSYYDAAPNVYSLELAGSPALARLRRKLGGPRAAPEAALRRAC